MKKRILFALAFVFTCFTMYANPNGLDRLPLMSKPIKIGTELKPFPKSPVEIPEVYLNGDTLTFDETLEGCTIQLLNEDENIVFSDSIAENQTNLILPTTLTGTFELQIITDTYIFYCEIEL